MPAYVIERTVPGAGQMDGPALAALAAESNRVLGGLGDGIEWDHSYVTDDRIVCIYRAESEDVIREHGRCGGFPVDSLDAVRAIINPATGAGAA